MNAPEQFHDEHLAVPPHSIETEQGILGALLTDNDAFDRITELRETHFYRFDHRLIFECIAKLLMQNRPADVITVFEWLQAAGRADDVGGLQYLNALAQNTPSTANIRRYAQIVIDRWKLRGLISTVDEIGALAFHPNGKTVDSIIEQAQTSIANLAEDREHEPALLRTALSQVVEEIDQQFHGAGTKRTPTGFTDLDYKLNGGMAGGNLIIVAGRPSMGKSALAMGIGEHVAGVIGLPVAAFSMEMSSKELAQRTIARVGELPLPRVIDGSKMLDGDWPLLTMAIQKSIDYEIYIDETPAATLGYIRARTKAIKRKRGALGLVIIDYLQLMSAGEGENRTQQVGANSRGLKALAKELDCPIMLLSQLNRGLEQRPNKRPQMSDLRDTGDIEQDADIILMLYRDEVYNPDSMDRGIAEIGIAKQRNGALGKVGLAYIGEQTRFANLVMGTSFGSAPAPAARAKRGFE